MWIWIIGGLAAAALGYKVFADETNNNPNRPKPRPPNTPDSSGGIPLDNGFPTIPNFIPTLDSSGVLPGQTRKIPFNQLPAGMLPATMLATMQSTGAQGVLFQVKSIVTQGVVDGSVIASYDANNDRIMLPIPVPLTVPTTILQ